MGHISRVVHGIAHKKCKREYGGGEINPKIKGKCFVAEGYFSKNNNEILNRIKTELLPRQIPSLSIIP